MALVFFWPQKWSKWDYFWPQKSSIPPREHLCHVANLVVEVATGVVALTLSGHALHLTLASDPLLLTSFHLFLIWACDFFVWCSLPALGLLLSLSPSSASSACLEAFLSSSSSYPEELFMFVLCTQPCPWYFPHWDNLKFCSHFCCIFRFSLLCGSLRESGSFLASLLLFKSIWLRWYS